MGCGNSTAIRQGEDGPPEGPADPVRPWAGAARGSAPGHAGQMEAGTELMKGTLQLWDGRGWELCKCSLRCADGGALELRTAVDGAAVVLARPTARLVSGHSGGDGSRHSVTVYGCDNEVVGASPLSSCPHTASPTMAWPASQQ
jgi:hypothetical protein